MKTMSPSEYRTALEKLNLDQRGGATFLCINERTSRRYIAGDREIPNPLALLLRYMVKKRVDPDDVTGAPVIK